MRIYTEMDFESFEPWSGACSTHERICNHGKAKLFEQILQEAYPEGLTESGLNDLLHHETDWCYKVCGLKTEAELRDEFDALDTERDELLEHYETACHDWEEETTDERDQRPDSREILAKQEEIWKRDYADRYKELSEEMAALKAEIASL